MFICNAMVLRWLDRFGAWCPRHFIFPVSCLFTSISTGYATAVALPLTPAAGPVIQSRYGASPVPGCPGPAGPGLLRLRQGRREASTVCSYFRGETIRKPGKSRPRAPCALERRWLPSLRAPTFRRQDMAKRPSDTIRHHSAGRQRLRHSG